jgi:uncharacterized protein
MTDTADEVRVRHLDPVHTMATPASETLSHARQQVGERGLDDYFIVDVDSHREPTSSWNEIGEYIEDPRLRAYFEYRTSVKGQDPPYMVRGFTGGHGFQRMFGRVVHGEGQPSSDERVHRDVARCREAMDALGIDIQVVFPTVLLGLGMSPTPEAEAYLAYAYDRWFVERFCPEEPRIKFLPVLPMRSPDMCLRIVRELGDKPGVVGFLVTSVRQDPVQDNKYMALYAELEERGLPLAFHAGPTWDDEWTKSMNRFIAVHALTFVHCNIVHMTNWIINGLPEKFPGLRVIWVESGLAWVPFLMQRLDSEFLKRTNEAPLLRRLPSEYMREMYYTSQPMERDNLDLLQSTMRAMNAETQLLYASDWPHWDFDLPSSVTDLPFLSEQAKRNILGENARRLFRL